MRMELRKINDEQYFVEFTREADNVKRGVKVSKEELDTFGYAWMKEKDIIALDEFQVQAMSTRTGETLGDTLIIYPALGLNGEAGEVAEKVKKVIRDDKGVWSEEKKRLAVLEVFDCLWYCMALLQDFGYSFSQCVKMGLEKLASRKRRNKLNGSGDER